MGRGAIKRGVPGRLVAGTLIGAGLGTSVGVVSSMKGVIGAGDGVRLGGTVAVLKISITVGKGVLVGGRFKGVAVRIPGALGEGCTEGSGVTEALAVAVKVEVKVGLRLVVAVAVKLGVKLGVRLGVLVGTSVVLIRSISVRLGGMVALGRIGVIVGEGEAVSVGGKAITV